MTVSINFKIDSPSCDGGAHYSVNLTPGPTVLLHAERAKEVIESVNAMSAAERVLLTLCLHANANNLTAAQVRAEVASVNGLDLVL